MISSNLFSEYGKPDEAGRILPLDVDLVSRVAVSQLAPVVLRSLCLHHGI